MMSKKMANGSSRNKNRVFDCLNGDECSEIDPSYRMFLEHLSEDGKSYGVDVPDGDHGMPASVRYEEDDVSGRDAHINVEEMDASIDESYAAFLSLMKIEDGFMVVEPEPGVTFVYEQEDETPAGYDEMRRTVSSKKDRKHLKNALANMIEDRLGKTDNITSERGINGPAADNFHTQDLICTDEHGLVPYTESSAFNVCENEQGEPIAFSSGVPSTFDEKLGSVLSKPYDQSEYEELLRKATHQQPVSRLRHLRNASKRYATEIPGLSYLDHYPDLDKQIRSANTDEGRLNLLRKFFFWLENLTHEGAHMPWVSKGLAGDPIVADD